LAGLVFGVDLLWSLTALSTGGLAYGLADEFAHLATCAILLLAAVQTGSLRPSVRFVTAALLASVAIDIDHIPGYLGSHLLTGSLPRPYSHSMLLAAALLALGWAWPRRRARELSFGIGFGVSAHLLRDLATGPGAPLAWPISSAVVTLPYAAYGALLAVAASSVPLTARMPGFRT
jgi:inner membrane protein